MRIDDDKYCFACGNKNPYGLKLKFEVNETNHTCSCKTILSKFYQGWKDITHGGIIATILDEAAAYVAGTFGYLAVTVELNVKYKKAVPLDKEILIKGEVIEKKKKIFFIKSWIELDNEIYAEAIVKMFGINELNKK